MASRRERAATRLDQKRRLAAARGKDPDAWQKDQERRHHFPLPHPHDARKGLRDRIDERQRLDYNRRDRWAAHRRGKPIPPKLHSERRKRKIEQKGQKRANEKDAKKKDKKRRDGPDEEKAAADKEMAEAAEKPKGKRGEPVRRPNARSAEE